MSCSPFLLVRPLHCGSVIVSIHRSTYIHTHVCMYVGNQKFDDDTSWDGGAVAGGQNTYPPHEALEKTSLATY